MEHSAIKETRPRRFHHNKQTALMDSTNGIGSVKTECDRDAW